MLVSEHKTNTTAGKIKTADAPMVAPTADDIADTMTVLETVPSFVSSAFS